MPRADPRRGGNAFAVQKHWARSLHYDFRLQVGDVLASWAVPKGPSLDPTVRRLAVRVDDHPLGYLLFEGVLPEGEYGAGRVIVWDYGTYELPGPHPPDIRAQLDQGHIEFSLEGKKLRGLWTLIRTKMPMGDRENWLLRKQNDEFAVPGYDIESQPTSALTGRAPPPASAAMRGVAKGTNEGKPARGRAGRS